ncbi:excalibur calcium-binding domain-containing protein [Cupriavidus sp. 30B13]|uniref:excalibur calcium-binding domain-containing protein n=1 Tax=Cupriavidus sp. 30B13 TaxID=3384241 RepID=UPI003B90B382
MNKFLVIGAALIAAGFYFKSGARVEAPGPTPEPAIAAAAPAMAPPAAAFRCEGKQRCSEMRSCEEARFYLRNCPGVKIDGDGDGIPCEPPPLRCS